MTHHIPEADLRHKDDTGRRYGAKQYKIELQRPAVEPAELHALLRPARRGHEEDEEQRCQREAAKADRQKQGPSVI